jgi:hypothetical protein
VRSRFLPGFFAVFAALFASAQLLGATTSSFSATTGTSGNTISASSDWTPPSVTGVTVQKSLGGVVDKIRPGTTFYVYANVSDIGSGTVTASVSNIATVSSATMTAGSYSVNGTSYNFRTAQLTAKSTLTTTTYSLSVTANDGVNTPSTVSDTVASSTATFSPSGLSSTNVNYAGKPWSGDKFTMTYSSTPDPGAVFEGWDGTARSVTVTLADYQAAGTPSDAIGITNADGSTTDLGYVTIGGDYIDAWQVVSFTNSSVVLSGNSFIVTLGTPNSTSVLNTDSNARTMTWTSTYSMFNQWGATASSVSRNSSNAKQF